MYCIPILRGRKWKESEVVNCVYFTPNDYNFQKSSSVDQHYQYARNMAISL